MKIKTSYELACERIIASDPKPKLKVDNNEYLGEEPFQMPDFVQAWTPPHGQDEFQDIVLEGSTATQSMIDHFNPIKKQQREQQYASSDTIEHTPQQKREVIVQQPYTVKFDLQSQPSVHWYGHFTNYGGFSRMNRTFAFSLANKGINVKTDIQKCKVEINEATHQQLQKMSRSMVTDKAPKIYGATVPLSFAHGGKKILYTMMENSCSLHPSYVGKLNMFNEIWVPTHFNKKLFKENGVHPPVYVMPLGVDTKRYNTQLKQFDFQQPLKEFVFLSVFKWSYRKGYDILLKSFLEEFSAGDNVTLLLVSRAEAFNDPNQIQKDFAAIRNMIPKDDDELPHVALYDQEIPEKYMPYIYGSANAFVLPSRGEGFGLPFMEAGASGLPIIASSCSGHSDFLNEDNSFVINHDGYVKADKTNLRQLANHCRFYEDQYFPNFNQNSIEEAKQHMRFVYENYDRAIDKAKIFRQQIEEKYTWDHAVQNVYNRVLDLME